MDSVENKIETTYERKISSTERCETPMEVPGAAMATAKAAYVASHAELFLGQCKLPWWAICAWVGRWFQGSM